MLRNALEERRAQIRVSGSDVIIGDLSVDSETSLYRLMVIGLPCIRRLNNGNNVLPISDILSWVSDVAKAVSIEDFRMIDALNVIYEAWAEDWEKDSRKEFLKYYAYALDHIIAKL